MPIPRPQARAFVSVCAPGSAMNTNSTAIAAPRKRWKAGVVSPRTVRRARRRSRELRGRRQRPRAPPRDRAKYSRDEPHSGSEHDRIGPKTKRNFRTPKSNSTGKTQRPISRPPLRDTFSRPTDQVFLAQPAPLRPPSRRPSTRAARTRSHQETRRTADQHQVRWAPRESHLGQRAGARHHRVGSPARANAPLARISTPPTGAYQSAPILIALAAGF